MSQHLSRSVTLPGLILPVPAQIMVGVGGCGSALTELGASESLGLQRHSG